MGEREVSKTDNLRPSYHRYKYQKCFIGHSHNASWGSTLVEVCDEVLPAFGLRPWYADAHFDPTTSLRDKVVEMVANTRFGIYDLSYWRRDEQSLWMMPRNVLIELGMAIALNRPILLLRHASNQVAGLALPGCLQSVGTAFCEFAGGKKSLREALNRHLPQWIERSPEREWRNRYCLFGGLVCDYRGSHPLSPLVAQNTITCHIADGQDIDRGDFRDSVEDIIERFDAVSYHYLDDCTPSQGYNFLLCAHCQLVRSTPFAIYRLTSRTPAETFIAIGISIALEAQFKYKIPKILLTETLDYVPSLLRGYEVVVMRNDQEMRARLTQFLPQVIQRVQETTWKPQALPFEVSLPSNALHLLEREGPTEDEIQPSETSGQTGLYDFSFICSPDGQDWVSWICWALEQVEHTVSATTVASTAALREALISTDRQAKSIVLLLSPDMVGKLNITELLEIQSVKSRLIAVQTYRGRIRLQPSIARRLAIVDLTTQDEQTALAILLSQVTGRDTQRQSTVGELRKDASLLREERDRDRRPPFPGKQVQREEKGIKLFYSYSHNDRALRDELAKHLGSSYILGWHDRDIVAGMDWAREIDVYLNSADIIILLVSSDFLASKYCRGIEMKRAMERYTAGEAIVIPVILRAVRWQDEPFGSLQALPSGGKPVTTWINPDEAFVDIARGVHQTIEKVLKRREDIN